MPIIAFDSKDFRRGRIELVDNPEKPGMKMQRYLGFHTPLGAGVWFKDEEKFKTKYVEVIKDMIESFELPIIRSCYSSTTLKREIGLRKAFAFCDKLITQLQKFIKFIHISYIILPPDKIPTVRVEGNQCPEREIETTKFIENLGPMFSYLTAYSFLGKPTGVADWTLHIDSFRSKHTTAWDELVSRSKPLVFPKGDECNPYISLSDIIAFLTDAKLYNQHLRLEPDHIKKIWEDYTFDTNIRFFDSKVFSKYKWYDNSLIDIKEYLARPAVFLIIDEIEKIMVPEEEMIEPGEPGVEYPKEYTTIFKEKRKRFREVIEGSDVYSAALNYASQRNGCLQFYHRYEDMNKVRDGDVLVYVGPNSKRIAETFSDAYEVEVFSGRELRRKIGN